MIDRDWMRGTSPSITRAAWAVAAAAALCPLDAPAQPGAADATVLVHATHWQWSGRAFDDLDVLAAAILPRTPRSVALRDCGAGAARPLLAAAERFRHLELELAAGDAEAGECRSAIVLASAGAAMPVLHGIDDVAVARWWLQTMP